MSCRLSPKEQLHEMSNPVFWKNKKKHFKLPSAEIFTQHAKRYPAVAG